MYQKLKNLCKEKGITVTQLCIQVTGNSGNLATWKKGYMRSDYLAKAADVLNCSTDYMLDRTDDPNGTTYQNINSKNFVNVNNGNDITIQSESKHDTITEEFIELFNLLDITDKITIMNLVLEKTKGTYDNS